MTTFTIKSKLHGDQSFFVPDQGGYVRLESGRNHGTLGKQICDGGGFHGSTLEANSDTLEKVARRWWKQRLAADRNA
jgi:hypothetical protein